MLQIDLITCVAVWVSLVTIYLEGIPQIGIILSSNNLPIVKAGAVLHGKASTSCNNIQITTKTYLYLWDGDIYMSKGPLGRGKWPCDP